MRELVKSNKTAVKKLTDATKKNLRMHREMHNKFNHPPTMQGPYWNSRMPHKSAIRSGKHLLKMNFLRVRPTNNRNEMGLKTRKGVVSIPYSGGPLQHFSIGMRLARSLANMKKEKKIFTNRSHTVNNRGRRIDSTSWRTPFANRNLYEYTLENGNLTSTRYSPRNGMIRSHITKGVKRTNVFTRHNMKRLGFFKKKS